MNTWDLLDYDGLKYYKFDKNGRLLECYIIDKKGNRLSNNLVSITPAVEIKKKNLKSLFGDAWKDHWVKKL